MKINYESTNRVNELAADAGSASCGSVAGAPAGQADVVVLSASALSLMRFARPGSSPAQAARIHGLRRAYEAGTMAIDPARLGAVLLDRGFRP